MNVKQTGIFFAGSATQAVGNARFPSEYNSRLIDRIEKRFLVFLAGTALVMGGITLILSMRELPDQVSDKEIMQIQERYARLVLDQPKPKIEPKPQETRSVESDLGDTPKEEEKKVDRKKETFAQKQERKQATSQERRQRREQVKKQIQSTGIFAAITAAGGSGGSAGGEVNDLLGAVEGVGDIGDIDISEGTFAAKQVDPQELEKRRGSRTSGVGIEKKSIGATQGARIASKGNVAIKSRPAEVSAESGTPVTSKACIQKIITTQSRRIKRVYENWLKRDPSLSGQLKVKFTILPSGLVTNVSVFKSTTGNSGFDQNVLRYIKRWNFSNCTINEKIEVVFPFAFEGAS